MNHAPTKHYYDALTRMVKVLKDDGHSIDRVLEIGTGWGISGSVFLEAGCKRLVTIDPNMGVPYVRASLRELNARCGEGQSIIPINASSDDLHNLPAVIGQRFDMAFVDGRHDYENVLQDIRRSRSQLRGGGVIICDDYTHKKNGSTYGVAQAVAEYLGDIGADATTYVDKTGNGLIAIIHH